MTVTPGSLPQVRASSSSAVHPDDAVIDPVLRDIALVPLSMLPLPVQATDPLAATLATTTTDIRAPTSPTNSLSTPATNASMPDPSTNISPSVTPNVTVVPQTSVICGFTFPTSPDRELSADMTSFAGVSGLLPVHLQVHLTGTVPPLFDPPPHPPTPPRPLLKSNASKRKKGSAKQAKKGSAKRAKKVPPPTDALEPTPAINAPLNDVVHGKRTRTPAGSKELVTLTERRESEKKHKSVKKNTLAAKKKKV